MAATTPKLLCVDDQPENLDFLEAMLLPKGYEVIKAENGGEALEKLKEERVDLVILNVKMPKMDGFEVCRRIKEDDRYRNIPVVIITGLTANKERIKGIEAGAEDFISKPFDPEELLTKIKMLLKAKTIDERLRQIEDIGSKTTCPLEQKEIMLPYAGTAKTGCSGVLHHIIGWGIEWTNIRHASGPGRFLRLSRPILNVTGNIKWGHGRNLNYTWKH